MKTSIYLTNRSITAVCGGDSGRGVKVKRCCRQEIPWGLVYNGTVADAEALTPLLGEFWNANKLPRRGVSLVVDSDAIAGRILDVPKLGARRLRDLIRNEMTIDQPGENYVYDYSVIAPKGEGGGGKIYAVAAERTLVQGFMNLFQTLDITLRGIDITQVCAMRFFQRAPEYRGRTFIYSLLDGPDILSILFTDGEYSFIDRGQLMEARGTPAAAVEISRAIQSMAQYNYASGTVTPLSQVYIGGLTGEETQFYGDIADALGMAVGPAAPTAAVGGDYLGQQGIDYGEYIFCLGDLID